MKEFIDKVAVVHKCLEAVLKEADLSKFGLVTGKDENGVEFVEGVIKQFVEACSKLGKPAIPVTSCLFATIFYPNQQRLYSWRRKHIRYVNNHKYYRIWLESTGSTNE